MYRVRNLYAKVGMAVTSAVTSVLLIASPAMAATMANESCRNFSYGGYGYSICGGIVLGGYDSYNSKVYPAGRLYIPCLLYTSPSPRDRTRSRMPSSA